MSNQPPSPPPLPNTKPPKRSVLLPLGAVLIVLGFTVPRPLTEAAKGMSLGPLRSIAFIGTDVFRLCFFAGVGCVIIGALRNQNQK